ncbi:MAG TPA: type IX secretion system sortase PorU, partial [Flavisolibacter sp.]|nr:type IX secretion system sortase PorU [Flavisolibacter sp.]
MFSIPKLLILSVLTASMLWLKAQRTYKSSSVLATGNWYKFSVDREGIYKIDPSFLAALGIQGSIPSGQVRIFGNGGGMLPESNAGSSIDDLEEIAIMVNDGGDGVFDAQDQILFYARGPNPWSLDSNSGQYHHIKNLYSDKAYFFITVEGVGKRVRQQISSPVPQKTISSFDDHYFHELDTINFLSSGKEWFGEEMANAPGKTLALNYNTVIPGIIPGQPARITSNVVARSLNTGSSFSVSVNGIPVQQIPVPGVGTGILDPFAQQVEKKDNFTASPNPVVTLNFTPGSFNSQGWLNWFELFYRRSLEMPPSGQLPFRDMGSVGTPSVEYVISNTDARTQVWDVTDMAQPVTMISVLSGNQLRFTNDALQLKEYFAFSNNYLSPLAEGKVANQNLHASGSADYFIITTPEFLSEAKRLAGFHEQHDQLKTIVVTTEQVYNEFSGGSPDPSALRNFVRMFYDRYRTSWKDSGKYLLLFGKGSFDYKNRVPNNTALVPVYESNSSLDPLSTYTSDDFYGFLDENEDINSGLIINTLDIGIGRVPAKNLVEAKNFVEKVFTYHSAAS